MSLSNKELLDKIKNQVAYQNGGWASWDHILDGQFKDKLWDIVCERYAIEKAKASCEATIEEIPGNLDV